MTPAPRRAPFWPKYLRHSALAVQETLAYRVAYLINIASGTLFYLVVFFVWKAVYGSAAAVGGFTWPEMQGYLLVSLFTSTLVSGASEFRISRQIRSGNIAVELMRPVDYQAGTFFITLGNSLSEGAVVAAIGLAFALCLPSAALPPDLGTWLALVPAVLASMTVKFLLIYTFGLAGFWTQSLLGISWLRKGITDFFSGALIPLSFFPPWLLAAADLLPFRSIVYVPAMVFIGKLSGAALARALGMELLWALGLWLLSRGIWRLAMRRVCVQGG